MAGVNDYVVSLILEMKSRGLENAALVDASLADLVAEAKKTNLELDALRDHARDSSLRLREMSGTLDDMNTRLRTSEEELKRHGEAFRNMEADVKRGAAAAENVAQILENKLTPALRNSGVASKSGQSGFMAFVDAVIPGGAVAAKVAVAIGALAIAFGPFVAELGASLVLLGAWVVGATAFAATIALAAGPIIALTALIIGLGISATGGTKALDNLAPAQKAVATATEAHDAAVSRLAASQASLQTQAQTANHNALATAQRAVATATNQNEAAQETLARAQLAVTSAAHPTALQMLALQQAQEQAKESAANLTKAQQGLNIQGFQPTTAAGIQLKAQQDAVADSADKLAAAQQALTVAQINANGPFATLDKHFEGLVKTLGQAAIPMMATWINWIDTLIPRIQGLALSMFAWYNDRLPGALAIAKQGFENALSGIERLATAWGHFYDRTVTRAPEFGNIINGAWNRIIDGAIGLMLNLERLSNWFVERLPTLGANANATFANLGYVVQGVGTVLGHFVDWIIEHWPGINAVFNASWQAIKDGWNLAKPILDAMLVLVSRLGPTFKYIADNGRELKVVMETLGVILLILVAALTLLFIIGVALVDMVVRLLVKFRDLMTWLSPVWETSGKIAKEAWPALKKAGEELWGALSILGGTFLSLVDDHAKTVDSAKKVNTAVQDNRDAFTRFFTSPAFTGLLAWFAVDMPHAIEVTVGWMAVAIIRTAELMNEFVTAVKVGADIAKHDFVQAGIDMAAGQKISNDLIKKDQEATTAAIIATNREMDGTVQTEHDAFIANLIAGWAHLHTQTVSEASQIKHENLQILREMEAEAVGKSIIPDMVNSILFWFGLMRGGSIDQTNLMKNVVNALQSAMAISSDLNHHNMYSSANFWFRAIHDTATSWAQTTAGKVGDIWSGMVGGAGQAFSNMWHAIRDQLSSIVGLINVFIGGVDTALFAILGHDAIPRIDVAKMAAFAGGGVVPGYAPGQDTVPAMLSPGEGILTPQAVRGIGGPEAIQALNTQYFAAGGVVSGSDIRAWLPNAGAMLQGPGGAFSHKGLNAWDFSVPMGSTLYAGVSGTVNPFSQGSVGYGNAIQFAMDQGGFVILGHLMRALLSGHVSAGTPIGLTDNTGFSTGPHLHFEVRGSALTPGGAGLSGIDVISPLVNAALAAAKGQLGNIPEWIRDLPSNLLDQVASATISKFASTTLGSVASAAVNLPGNVVSWIQQALTLTGKPASWLGPLEALIAKESSGNPGAVNPITVLGQHATGILQMLGSTFAAHWLPGHHNILNPVDNIASAIQYIASTYGNPNNIPGLFGGAYSGYDNGGQLPVGLSTAWNGTGRTETVTPADTMDRLEGLLGDILQELRIFNGRQRMGSMTASGQFG